MPNVLPVRIEAVSIDRRAITVHPDDTGTKNTVHQAIGRIRGGLYTKILTAAAGIDQVLGFSLTPGRAHDGRGATMRTSYQDANFVRASPSTTSRSVALNALLSRLAGLRLAVPEEELRWRLPSGCRGLEALPVVWDVIEPPRPSSR